MCLENLIASVATRALDCPIAIWGFGIGGLLSGLVRAGERLQRPEWIAYVADLVAPALAAPPAPTDHLIPVEALIALARTRPDLDIGPACSRWANAVLAAPRPATGGLRVHRRDLARWSTTIWVDCMHTDGPGLAILGRPEEAVAAAQEYATVLQRRDGLFHHGYDVATGLGNGVAWGRGQGWALLGLVETLRAVPPSLHVHLRRRLERLIDALARHEDGGRWHTIVDDPASPVEHSVAAYAALGFRRAVDAGLTDTAFSEVAERAWRATLAVIGTDGGLEVSEATPVGDGINYRQRASGVFAWGQAPILHAALDRLASDREDRQEHTK